MVISIWVENSGSHIERAGLMKRQVHLFLSSLTLAFSFAAHGQGTFQNLGFEAASLVPIPGDGFGRVQFDAAFPNWIGYVGGVQQGSALYNSTFLDSAGIGIIDNNFPGTFNASAGVLAGSYSAILQAGVSLNNPSPTLVDTTLSQTSLVPVSANSLRFRVYYWPNPLLIFLGGQRLPLVELQSAANYTLLGADVRAWQGQVARLDFHLLHPLAFINNTIKLDAIQFSVQPIPEPATFGLIALGAVALGGGMLRRNRT